MADADARRPHPAVTRDTAFFWEGAREHRLLVQRCTDCGRPRHPPTAGCRFCGSPRHEVFESSGRGTVFSYTVIHPPLPEPFADGHVVALVELEEGVRILSELRGAAAADVTIGVEVAVGWLDCDASLTLPVFEPRR